MIAADSSALMAIERRIVTIPVEGQVNFEAWVEAPAKDIPALRKLSAARPAWQS